MEQRVSLITLGVRDMGRAAAFREALGWQRAGTSDGIVVLDLVGQSLGLYPLADLARDVGVPEERLGHGTATYACNVREKAEVTRIIDAARAAGAAILRPAHDVFRGGHIGYCADSEGHAREVAWTRFSPLSPAGQFGLAGH